MDNRETGAADASQNNPPWLQTASVTYEQTHTHNQVHCTHKDRATHTIFWHICNRSSGFLVYLQVVFSTLALIGGTLMFIRNVII